jgi:hypothetical protein
MANELIFYLKSKLNSGILIQNLFWICIWLQNKSCSFWNVMKSNQFSQFVELCNSCFGISFEVAVLRIYCVTCYVGLLTSGPDHSSNRNFWRKISIPHNFIWTRMHLKFGHNVKLTKILKNMKLHYQLICKIYLFYYPLLIKIYWIACYVGSLTNESDHGSNGWMTSFSCCYCDHFMLLLWS